MLGLADVTTHVRIDAHIGGLPDRALLQTTQPDG